MQALESQNPRLPRRLPLPEGAVNRTTEALIHSTVDTIRQLRLWGPEIKFDRRIAPLIAWSSAGFPVVRLQEDVADAFCATDPPSAPHTKLDFSGLVIEIGGGSLVTSARLPAEVFDDAPEWFPPKLLEDMHRTGQVAAYALEEFVEGSSMRPAKAREDLDRLIANVIYVLQEHRAKSAFDGLSVAERVPSVRANRKRGRKYLPGVEYVIGSTSKALTQGSGTATRATNVAANTIGVRTRVRGFWRSQPHGPGRSLRKVIWVRPHWRGPEGAPISIHTVVL